MINHAFFSSIFIANWKLNGNFDFIKEYFLKLKVNSKNCIVICPPNIYLNSVKQNNVNLFTGAQDVSIYQNGAYTGELSARMLQDTNIHFCLVGHSERRQFFNETNETVNLKSKNLIENKIIPVICIGENFDEKKQNKTKDILTKQLNECIPEISDYENTIIAYEPLWAIGTGITPSLEEIEEVHYFIKNLDKKFNQFKVLYGGSVKPSNSAEIVRLKNVNGCLIGGASLKVDEFNSIIT